MSALSKWDAEDILEDAEASIHQAIRLITKAFSEIGIVKRMLHSAQTDRTRKRSRKRRA